MQAKCQFVVAKGQKGKDRQCVFCVSYLQEPKQSASDCTVGKYYSQGKGGMMRTAQEEARKSQDQTVLEKGVTEWPNESSVWKKGSD